MDANKVSLYVGVITDSDKVTELEKTTVQGVYKYFVMIATRTDDGQQNMRNDAPTARSLSIRFDRETLKVSVYQGKHLVDAEAVVLVAGDGDDRKPLGRAEKAILRDFCQRSGVDMTPIVRHWETKLRDKEVKVRNEFLRKVAAEKTRKFNEAA
jgi:hypothetical protein